MGYENNFCEKLREIRRERYYTQKQIAEKLGVPPSTYANWEQGRTQPSIDDIYKLMNLLKVDANELFDVSKI